MMDEQIVKYVAFPVNMEIKEVIEKLWWAKWFHPVDLCFNRLWIKCGVKQKYLNKFNKEAKNFLCKIEDIEIDETLVLRTLKHKEHKTNITIDLDGEK